MGLSPCPAEHLRGGLASHRHAVREGGRANVTWLWTINQDRQGTGPIEEWWPGSKYVTWVGIDGYYLRASDTFGSVFGSTIQQVRVFTKKPILLSETGVGPRSNPFPKIQDLFAGMHQYKTLGLVWFDKDQTAASCTKTGGSRATSGCGRAFRLVCQHGWPAPEAGGRSARQRLLQRGQDRHLPLDQFAGGALDGHPLGPVHLGKLLDHP